MDRIAKAGLRYTQFHSTALCSPTRAALITGRNHHSVGFGVIGELSTGYPGYDSIIGPENATIGDDPEGQRLCHLVVRQEPQHARLPIQRWPGPSTNGRAAWASSISTASWAARPTSGRPTSSANTRQIFPWVGKPGYNLTTDLADEAIKYMSSLNAAAPDKPFFVYYVPGGTHSPHQPTQGMDRQVQGQVRHGLGEAARADLRQPEAARRDPGEYAAHAVAGPTCRSGTRCRWCRKKLYAREAEVFAAYAAYTDHEIGRVIQAVEDMGKLDNTLIIYISGDNGTSAEGTLEGTPNQMTAYNGILTLPEAELMLNYEAWGSDKTYPHMAVAWSWAFDTPFKWTKQVASHFGGTRQGMAISWPGHIKDAGGIRTQFHHMIDIVPTILEAAGIPAPATVNGIAQRPIEGVSMAYTFDKANANAPSKRDDAVFRDGRQPRDLPRRLDRLHDAARAAVAPGHRQAARRSTTTSGSSTTSPRTSRNTTTSPPGIPTS